MNQANRQEFDLDSFSNLYLDAINYREEKGELHVKLGTIELEAVKFMRERLLQHLGAKHGLGPDTHEMAVDTKLRKLIITEKPAPPAPPIQPAPEPAPVPPAPEPVQGDRLS